MLVNYERMNQVAKVENNILNWVVFVPAAMVYYLSKKLYWRLYPNQQYVRYCCIAIQKQNIPVWSSYPFTIHLTNDTSCTR